MGLKRYIYFVGVLFSYLGNDVLYASPQMKGQQGAESKVSSFISRDYAGPLPLTYGKLSERSKWSLKIAKIVDEFFRREYTEKHLTNPFKPILCKDGYTVFRPNHSLAHGIRQAYLAVDVVLFIQQAKNKYPKEFKTSPFFNWVLDKLNHDKKFLKKIQFINAFQRSGRNSEASRKTDKEAYESYLKQDQENFLSKARDYVGEGKLFDDMNEVEAYKEALVRKFDVEHPPNISNEVFYLSKIFYGAHLLDLRRIHGFNKGKILYDVSVQLFGGYPSKAWQNEIIQNLWSRSGDYLKATGDRDMEDKRGWDVDIFCRQAKNPELMIQALQFSIVNPQEKLFESIVAHSQSMRELKKSSERKGMARTEPLQRSDESMALKSKLENAPYTASEAYLKILLGEKYIEIPDDRAGEDEIRYRIRENILLFLRAPKASRIENPDDAYVDVLVEAMLEERKKRGMIVLYHTTEPELGVLYDVYTEMRNTLMMEGGKDMRALRAVDTAFLRLDEEVYRREGTQGGNKATVTEFQQIMKGVQDNERRYQDMGLSTNFGLFGSDQQENSDSYNMFYNVKDGQVTLDPPKYDKFFNFIEQETGIPLKYAQVKPIIHQHVLSCEGASCRNGRLIQIFIDPEVVDKITYFSVYRGNPVLKEGVNPPLKEPLLVLRNSPMEFSQYLKNTEGGEPGNLKKPTQLHDLQARLFMRPEIMLNERWVQIKSYWRHGPPKDMRAYRASIEGEVQKSLAKWFMAGAPAQADAFSPETLKLKKFTNIVHKGTTGIEVPKAPPSTLEERFVRLLHKKAYDQAANMLEENHERFLQSEFMLPLSQSGQGGHKVRLKALILEYHPMFPLILVGYRVGLFKGGEEAFGKAFEKISEQKYYSDEARNRALKDLVKALEVLKDPARAINIYNQYLKFELGQENFYTSSYLDLLKYIDHYDDVESILRDLRPLFDKVDKRSLIEVFPVMREIDPGERGRLLSEFATHLTDIGVVNDYTFSRKLNQALRQYVMMKDLSPEKKRIVWAIAQNLSKGRFSTNWDTALYLLEGLKTQEVQYLSALQAALHEGRANREGLYHTYEELSFEALIKPITDFMPNAREVLRKYILTGRRSLRKNNKLSRASPVIREVSDYIKINDEMTRKLTENHMNIILDKVDFGIEKFKFPEHKKLYWQVIKRIVGETSSWDTALAVARKIMHYSIDDLKKIEDRKETSADILRGGFR